MNYYCYLILVQGLVENHFFGSPELLTDYKQLLGEVSVISRILRVEVRVISRCWRLRLITLTETFNVLDITKTESNNCFIIHWMKKMEVIFLLLHWHRQEATQSVWTWHDYPWPWVYLTWLLYNLQLWRHGHWFRKFTVRCCCCNNVISPRPSKLTPGQLLIDISCHLISLHFSFDHSSCLSYPPPPQKKIGPLLESILSLV